MNKRSFAELNKFPKYTSGRGNNKIKDNDEGNVSDEELMPKALPLQNDPDEFETEDSVDALQYLKRVRQEANTYEHNSVAKNLTNVTSAPISHNYAPNSYLFEYFNPDKGKKMQFLKEISSEWKEHITKTFDSLKRSLSQTKTSLDKGVNPVIPSEVQENKDDYKTLFAKRKDFKDIFNQKDLAKQKSPQVTAFSQFDRVVGEKLLDWVCDEITKIEEKKSILNSFQCLWIYSILLLFDKPLLPETSGDLNQILTYIVRVLAELEDQTIAQEKDPQGDIKPALIVNALIIMEYFGQRLYNM